MPTSGQHSVIPHQHGTTLPPMLAGPPPTQQELRGREAGSDTRAAEGGRRVVLDLREMDYYRSRHLLSESLRALDPTDVLLVVSSDDLRSLRFEMEATLSRTYRWCLHSALPVEDPTEFTTVVERV